MKNKIEFLKKYSLVILAITVCLLSLFQISCGNQSKPQHEYIDQTDIQRSESDRLNMLKANALLQQKDSIIKMLNSKLEKEKAKTTAQKADAKKQHLTNYTLQSVYEREQNLNTCIELVSGLKIEIVEKDSVIDSLDSEIDDYSSKVSTLENKVCIQSGVIESKQNLVLTKDSTIAYYKTQQMKMNFWSEVKTKAAGIIILIETIALLIK